ncbi:MAG: YkgJ family cysteine cluster protein [Bryobacteraceae bacterium]
MLTDLAEVRRIAESKQADNLRFRRILKARPLPNDPFHIIAAEVETKIDCTVCANCCKHTRVAVSSDEMEALAGKLEITRLEVMQRFTVRDPRDSTKTVLSQKRDACVFLIDNLCSVYEARPKACRDFPNLTTSEAASDDLLAAAATRSVYCPIAFNTLEVYKERLGYKPLPEVPKPRTFGVFEPRT